MIDERIEGSGASQLVQLIRTLGYNTDVTVEWATVIAPPPNISIQIDNMSVPLEKDDLIVVEALTKHTKKAKITGKNMTVSGGSISGATNNTGHEHSIASLSISKADLEIKEAEIEYDHELKKDDRVIVMGIHNGQTYIILGRVVVK